MRFASTVLVSSLLLGTAIGLVPGAAFAQSQDKPSSAAVSPADAPVGSLAPNQAHFLCTAAINSTGTIAGGNFVDPARTFKLGTGRYQVGFLAPCPNVQIANGWFRVIQPDTLNNSVMPDRSCYVADRFGVASALFIECFDHNGSDANTSFTVSVSR
jgi:hypothetical protein